MNEEIINISRSLDTLTMEQVAERIHAKDSKTARKWLQENDIVVHKYHTYSYVYQIEVESIIDKPFVQILRVKFPDKWKDRYKLVVKDIAVYNLTVSILEDEIPSMPKARVSNISMKDKERYNKLVR